MKIDGSGGNGMCRVHERSRLQIPGLLLDVIVRKSRCSDTRLCLYMINTTLVGGWWGYNNDCELR